MARNNTDLQTIRSEGGLFPADLLRRVVDPRGELPGTGPADYGLPPGERLNDAITQSWNRLMRYWADFRKAAEQLPEDNPGQGLTNEKWTLPLLRELGFGLLPTAAGPTVNGVQYPIARFFSGTPIHLLGCNTDLDRRQAGQRGASRGNPHGLVQEFLNRSDDHLWGILSNGLRLRILRDNQALSRQSYLEFDLEAMFGGEVYPDFALLWMVCHATRFVPPEGGRPEDLLLERWTRLAVEQGARALDQLRESVGAALQKLGQGFVGHPKNTALREALRSGKLKKDELHAELLRVVYRFIFLFVAEDRTLDGLPMLHPPVRDEAARQARERYARYYSTRRLRHLADSIRGGRHGDLWEQFNMVVVALSGDPEREALRHELALPALGSFLWDPAATAHLNAPNIQEGGASLANEDLLDALRQLAFILQNGHRRAVDYRNLGSEELGGVYEGLLALTPQVSADGARFSFEEFLGNKRRDTGSYYTPDSLVQCVLDAALDPLLEERLQGKNGAEAEQAILELKVCDPAVGSGHFLVGAAHRLARHLARARALAQGEGEPAPGMYQHALRDVIGRCLYGVDINPMSAELCRVNLWLEALEPGKPLSFLDHHIRVGNSLVGATPELVARGIPDGAFNALEGDDAEACTDLKSKNRAAREGLGPLFAEQERESQELLLKASEALAELPDDRPEEVRAKERALRRHEETEAYQQKKLLYDLWTAAFFIPKRMQGAKPVGITQAHLLALAAGDPVDRELLDEVAELVRTNRYFHWHLAYPEVFARGGFDVLLGNPPWERVKIQEKEYFAEKAPEIANARNKTARQALIDELQETNPGLAAQWAADTRQAQAESNFMRNSERYPLGGVGDVNTYAVFADLFYQGINELGAAGVILPNGLVTGFTFRHFLQDMLRTKRLSVFYGFENEDLIFPDVHHAIKFGVLAFHGESRPVERAWFTAYLRQPEEVTDPSRRYSLTAEEIEAINPNTMNLPSFRRAEDAAVMARIHTSAPVLLRKLDDGSEESPWGFDPDRMFDMANDSGLFLLHEEIAPRIVERKQALAILADGREVYPLYEGKMCWHFDHRYGTYEGQTQAQANQGVLPHVKDQEHNNPFYRIEPRYWIAREEVEQETEEYPQRNWLFVWRDVGPSERTLVGTIVPFMASGHTTPVLTSDCEPEATSALSAVLSSLVVDFDARQSSNRMTFYVVKQLAVLTPDQLSGEHAWLGASAQSWLAQRVLELCYTNVELEPFAQDLGYSGAPFRWDPDRRALLQAEIDAAVMHLYQLDRAQAEWILDSFTVLQKYEERDHGEFRTKRLVLERYDAMAAAQESGSVYETPLVPGPADPSRSHPPEVMSGQRRPDPVPRPAAPAQREPAAAETDDGTANLDPDQDAEAVLSFLKDNPGGQGRSTILAATGIGKDQWNPLIATLLNRGLVRKEGERRGTKYHLV